MLGKGGEKVNKFINVEILCKLLRSKGGDVNQGTGLKQQKSNTTIIFYWTGAPEVIGD